MENEFTTSDFGLAVTLLTFGFGIVSLNKTNPKRIMFHFSLDNPQELDIQRVVDAFWAKQLVVEPSTFNSNIRLLKSMIYNELNQTDTKRK